MANVPNILPVLLPDHKPSPDTHQQPTTSASEYNSQARPQPPPNTDHQNALNTNSTTNSTNSNNHLTHQADQTFSTTTQSTFLSPPSLAIPSSSSSSSNSSSIKPPIVLTDSTATTQTNLSTQMNRSSNRTSAPSRHGSQLRDSNSQYALVARPIPVFVADRALLSRKTTLAGIAPGAAPSPHQLYSPAPINHTNNNTTKPLLLENNEPLTPTFDFLDDNANSPGSGSGPGPATISHSREPDIVWRTQGLLQAHRESESVAPDSLNQQQSLLSSQNNSSRSPYAVKAHSRLANLTASTFSPGSAAASPNSSAIHLGRTPSPLQHMKQQSSIIPTETEEVSGLHVDPATARRVVLEFQKQQQLELQQLQQEQLRSKIVAYRAQFLNNKTSPAAHKAVSRQFDGLLEAGLGGYITNKHPTNTEEQNENDEASENTSVIAHENELTEMIAIEKSILASGASHWTPFVVSTIHPEVFERSARIDASELNAQNNLDDEWRGGQVDTERPSKNLPMRGLSMIKYLVCCFIPGGAMLDDLESDRDRPKPLYGVEPILDSATQEKYATGTAMGRGVAGRSSGYNDNYSDESKRARSTDLRSPMGGDYRHQPHYYREHMRSYVAKKKKKWLPKIFYVLLKGSMIPLVLRLFNIVLSACGLGLACSIFEKSHYTAVPQQASTIMAIVVQTCAVAYLMYISYDEYSSKPLGLRDLKEKMRLIMLDLLFIIFSSANLSLAFQTLFDSMWVCRTNKNFDYRFLLNGDPTPYNGAVCGRQRALVSFLIVILVSWITTFTISMFRLMDRISSRN
ncbi:uncharacterized protein SAPINGB_P005143 [Magnusiomyces paraingens]|uniref:Regulator of phospholipase D SRF1 n=1 Tax=Magnusiomyces paraingens TaxID=2606893 RepID=A0A5E8BYH5_9ASCO|nr:uncharacterized protein SAPINGB_P005143 [Saprochaete ingens]VVT56544.1 unnamed protein product [Saprochaete ingens]